MLTGSLILLLILESSPFAAAQVPPVRLEPAGESSVAEVPVGDRVVLDDGREVRLLGIDAPVDGPVAEESRSALAALIMGQRVTLYPGEAPTDRWERMVAHLVRQDGMWIQAELLRRGLARVHSFPDNRALVPEMLAVEAEARKARQGIWAHRDYWVHQPQYAGRVLNSFQLVEGVVLEAAKVRGRVYLNFGADWKTDFTVLVPSTVRRQFEKAGQDLTVLTGRTVRVRGWLKSWNGPMIELTHREQLEILDAPENP